VAPAAVRYQGTMRSLLRAALGAVAFATLAVAAGCGGGVSVAPVQPPSDPGSGLGTISSPVGPILATSNGFTLYDFVPDTATHSACVTDTCVAEWPPLVVTSVPTVGGELQQSLVTTLRRPDGQLQVVYAGHPLYRWAGDVKAGMITGQAVVNQGGAWYVISPSGQQIITRFSVIH
jgi:predicted lipoprotein with Yx(FWY)xxD motif